MREWGLPRALPIVTVLAGLGLAVTTRAEPLSSPPAAPQAPGAPAPVSPAPVPLPAVSRSVMSQRLSLMAKVTVAPTAGAELTVEPDELESVVGSALSARGARLVDVPLAADAQRLMWSARSGNAQAAGVDLRSVDAVLLSHLSCTETGRLPHGPSRVGLLSVDCSLYLKWMRADSGTVMAPIVVSGLSGFDTALGGAARSALRYPANRDKIQRMLDELANQLTANAERWSLDLSVTGLADRDQINALLTRLGALRGVSGARLAFRQDDLVQIVLEGNGANNKAALVETVQSDARLALAITYESPSTIAAYYDVARALPKAVAAQLLVSEPEARAAQDLLRAKLEDLPYLQVGTLSTFEGKVWPDARLKEQAAHARVDWLLLVTLAHQSNVWLATARLREAATGSEYLVASATGADPKVAIDGALAGFDTRYRSAWQDAKIKRILWPTRPAVTSNAPDLKLEEFRIVPRGAQDFGYLVVRNASQVPATAVEVHVVTPEGSPLGVYSTAAVEAQGQWAQALPLSAVPDARAPLEVRVSYDQGGRRHSLVRQAEAGGGRANTPRLLAAEALPEEYVRLAEMAEAHYRRGEWGVALKAMRAAYGAYPTGLGARLLGWIEFALKSRLAEGHLEAALSHTRGPLDESQRAHVREMLAQLRQAHGLNRSANEP
jgi:hypothetical protein